MNIWDFAPLARMLRSKQVRTWQRSIGHNVRQWRASPASEAAPGCLRTLVCRSPPFSRTSNPAQVSRKSWSGSALRGNKLLPCSTLRHGVLTLRRPPAIRRLPPMRILFDQGTPAPLIPFLEGHTVTQAKDLGWDKLVNGELLKSAEEAGFEVILTTDKNIAAQQNFEEPHHCDHSARKFAMAYRATPHPENSRCREGGRTRQLF